MQRSYNLMKEVARHHDVYTIAFRQRAHQPDTGMLDEGIREISRFCKVLHVEDAPQDRHLGGQFGLASRSLLSLLPYTIRWGLSRTYRDAVNSAISNVKPQIIHFDTVSLASYVDCVPSGVPAVLNHHNVESHMLFRRAHRERHLLRKLYYSHEARKLAQYERSVARRFQRHLVCAELDAQRLTEVVGPVATEIIPNGVDLEYFQPAGAGTPSEPGSLVFVGGLSWYPNASAVRFLLKEVWPLLNHENRPLRLRIAGRNPPPDIIRSARTDSRIEILGFVDDIRPLVHTSEVYVCPIFDGGGTKLKMLDAMAMGKAIVAHPVACEGLDVVDGVHVMQASTRDEFAEKIQMLLGNPRLRSDLEAQAYEHVKRHFSFSSIGLHLSTVYSSCIDDGHE